MSSTICAPYDPYKDKARKFRDSYELPGGISITSLKLQQTLIDEEHLELAHSYLDLLDDFDNKLARAHMLKELADLVYVCHQMAEAFGWDLYEAFKRVHESNMSKLDADGTPIRREDGKILKGPFYFEPTLIDLV